MCELRFESTGSRTILGASATIVFVGGVARITLQKWLLIMYMWARQYSVSDVAEEAEVTACN